MTWLVTSTARLYSSAYRCTSNRTREGGLCVAGFACVAGTIWGMTEGCVTSADEVQTAQINPVHKWLLLLPWLGWPADKPSVTHFQGGGQLEQEACTLTQLLHLRVPEPHEEREQTQTSQQATRRLTCCSRLVMLEWCLAMVPHLDALSHIPEHVGDRVDHDQAHLQGRRWE